MKRSVVIRVGEDGAIFYDESSYSPQIKSVRKLHDKLITFRRSDKSVFYRILAAETCFPPTPFPYAQRQKRIRLYIF